MNLVFFILHLFVIHLLTLAPDMTIIDTMKTVNIAKLKNNLSAIIAQLSHSGAIIVVDRSTPCAILSPLSHSFKRESESILLRLEQNGVVQRGSGVIPKEILNERPPKLTRKHDAVGVLIADREDRF